jgi:glycerol-3-phosphate acyltransferase PlsX
MRIALDAMGGDFAPKNEVLGAIEFLNEVKSVHITLVGDEKKIQPHLKGLNYPSNRLDIVHTSEYVTMEDSPTAVLKDKKNSSMALGLKLHKENTVQAFVSTGNTGAQLAYSTTILKRLDGVNRPGIGAFLPNRKGFTLMMDVGANVDCKVINLVQYAIMSDIMVRNMYHKKTPTLALLSIGEEEIKGNELTVETHQFLKKSNLNFIGNVEGRDVLKGDVDIIICDGFVGNIVLKMLESIMPFISENLKAGIGSNPFFMGGGAMLKPVLKKIKKHYNYETYGGVPLLGVNGISIICHGKSSPLAIKNALIQAKNMHHADINNKIQHELHKLDNVKI